MKRALLFTALVLVGCGSSGSRTTVVPVRKEKPPVEAKAAEPPAPREAPPESAPAQPFTAAKATWNELPNGLKIVSRPDRAVPLVHLRIAVLAGSAVDGERTGLSAVCARAVSSSGAGSLSDTDLQDKLETLGATLTVDIDTDRVWYGVSVVKDRLPEAFDLLSQIVTKPRLRDEDVTRVQKRLGEDAADSARGDGRWGAMMVLYSDLFSLPSEHHPYASYDATADDLAKIKPADCRAWHRKYFVPSNMLVAASGDVDAEKLRAAANKGLGNLRKAPAPLMSFTDPMPPESIKITLVDRPGGTQSEVCVGTLGPKRDDSSYPSFLVADQVIGGTYTGRLFTDVREKRGLAYLSGSNVDVYANGPSVFTLYAQTQNSSTGETLAALLDHAQKMAAEAPTATEVETASRFLAGWRALNGGIPGRTANELVDLWVRRQPDDAAEELAKTMRAATPETVQKVFAEHVRSGHTVIVVAGDAGAVGPLLQPFGEVKIVDPTRNFARIKTLPATAK